MAITSRVITQCTQLVFVDAESALDAESAVRRTVGPNMKEQLLNIPGWRGFDNPWMAEDDQDVDFSYINLVDNPERYTGYKVLILAHICTSLGYELQEVTPFHSMMIPACTQLPQFQQTQL